MSIACLTYKLLILRTPLNNKKYNKNSVVSPKIKIMLAKKVVQSLSQLLV